MSEPIRLSRRVIELAGCSRSQAAQYIEGGWVRVDGEIVDAPQHPVHAAQRVELDPDATLTPTEPATLLVHRPAELDPAALASMVTPESRAASDATGIRLLRRHFARLAEAFPLEARTSGLAVLTQDGRLLRRVQDEGERIEQEFVVEVSGEIAPYGLQKLMHGLSVDGRVLPPAKVSWQSETKLRFALKGVRPGQLAAMCAQVGLQVVASRRLRIGRVPLGRMALGEWRYLPTSERF
jgi:23S rRNA pseudouridine2604 synthase